MKKEFFEGEGFGNKESKHKRIEYPINQEIIKKVEENFGTKFPQSFIDLLLYF